MGGWGRCKGGGRSRVGGGRCGRDSTLRSSRDGLANLIVQSAEGQIGQINQFGAVEGHGDKISKFLIEAEMMMAGPCNDGLQTDARPLSDKCRGG